MMYFKWIEAGTQTPVSTKSVLIKVQTSSGFYYGIGGFDEDYDKLIERAYCGNEKGGIHPDYPITHWAYIPEVIETK